MDGSMGENLVRLYEILAILGMFILRLGVPLILVLGVGYVLRRLDRNWEAEATARRRALDAEILAAQLPQISMSDRPCWEVRSCPPRVRDGCPVHSRSGVACWIARYQAEGEMPAMCVGCSLLVAAQQAVAVPTAVPAGVSTAVPAD